MARTKKVNSENVTAETVDVKESEVKTEAVEKAAETKKNTSAGRKTAKAASSDEAKKTTTAKAAEPAKKKAPRKPKVTLTPFEEIVAAASKKTEKAKSFKDFAAQITMNGKVEGIFYVKSADGKVDVQPFDYKNADIYVTVDSDTLVSLMASGDVEKAVKDGKLEMSGGSLSTIVALKSVLF